VAHSLMLTAGRLGMHVAVATPPGYEPNPAIAAAAERRWCVTLTNDPREALSERTYLVPTCGPAWGRKPSDARQKSFEAYK